MPFKGKPLRWGPLLIVLLAYFYFATGGRMSLEPLALEPKATEAYQMLTEGFLEGRLGLSLDPDPAFVALPDPYDPVAHQDPRVWDVSYYKGRYYLVHGPLPAVLFYLPVRLLTGRYPNGALTLLFFGCLNFVFLYALLLRVKDQHFPEGSESYALLGGLSIGTGNVVLANMVADNAYSFYFTCLAASSAVLAMGLYALYRAMEEGAVRVRRWLWLASLGIAAAAAGRPTMAVGDILFLWGASRWVQRRSPELLAADGGKRGLLGAIWAPSLAVGLVLALYNFLRFGNPLDFGLQYQLNSLRMVTSGFISPWRALEYIRFNLKVDFLQRFMVADYFPFVRALPNPVWPDAPQPYYSEDNIGFFSLWPAGWLLLLLPAALGNWARLGEGPRRQPLAAFLWIMGLMTASQILIILSVSGSTFRYATDFAPSCMVLIFVAAWVLLDLPLSARWRGLCKGFFDVATLFGLLVSLNFALCGSRGLFAERIPGLAGWVNQWVHH